MPLKFQQTEILAQPQHFVDVIIPLFLDKPFTYAVPHQYLPDVAIGKRVLVQFGRRHVYTGIIAQQHQKKPETYQVKEILQILDDEPIVHPEHLGFWQWVTEYYCCSIGEVMDAALPSALKLKSNTIIGLHPAYVHDTVELDDKEFLLVEALEVQEELTLQDAIAVLQVKQVMPVIKSLHNKGVIVLSEDLSKGYKPKTVKVLALADDLQDEARLQAAFDVLESDKRQKKQSELLLQFMQYQKAHEIVLKTDLLNQSGYSTSVLKGLLKKGILQEQEMEVQRVQFAQMAKKPHPPLSEAQQQALAQIQTLHAEKTVCLLHGITSSGKTHIYAELTKQYLAQNQQVLYLVPEIALTTQLIARLQWFFGEELGVYHSRLNEQERAEIWHRVLKGEISMLVGARSAVFLPFVHLGLIIIDEEHEPSYKQHEPAPRYHARDAAIYLAVQHKAKVLLGSATPSLESYYNCRRGKYGLVELLSRHEDITPPLVEIVDLREMQKRKMLKGKLGLPLYDAISKALKNKQQTILFQNRRGFATSLECSHCGWVPKCKNCDISLTYHKYKNSLNCHYCGYQLALPKKCLACGHVDVFMKGFGTERIEDELQILYPEASIKRMDWETTRKKQAFSEIIRSMELGQTDILIGTQMVVKGLDFEKVKIVGILNADALMYFPDFRAIERSYQLMVQVAGRAGRKSHQGYVLIQSRQPEHYIFEQVKSPRGYKTFYQVEMQQRQQYGYPPFTRLVLIICRHVKLEKTLATADEMAQALTQLLGEKNVLGPESPGVGRIRNKYIRHILLKLPVQRANLSDLKRHMLETISRVTSQPTHKSVEVLLDIDPA